MTPEQIIEAWNTQADEYNQWCELSEDEKLRWAFQCAKPEPEQEPVAKYCCHSCFKKSGQLFLDRMILCPKCGNKRCPKATHHELQCTNSNESSQAGSVYTTPPQREWVDLTDDELYQGLLRSDYVFKTAEAWRDGVAFATAKLKEKNT